MHGDLSLKETQQEWHGSLKAYIIGFIASLLLTIASFALVMTKALPKESLIYTIIGLAIVQSIVQLIFFLHVGQEAKPRWETMTFFFMILILFIVVVGSLWIMYDLHERVMSDMGAGMPHGAIHD